MSKRLGQHAVRGLTQDFFGESSTTKFKLAPPRNFDLFNSLSLLETDSFSGISVSILKSTHWTHNSDIITSYIVDDTKTIYSGSYTENLPTELSIHNETFWIAITSKRVHQAQEFTAKLEELKITYNEEDKDIFFMFLRAHELISFNTTLRLQAEENISWQPEAEDYTKTEVSELFSYYEEIDIFKIQPDSPLHQQSVFWTSYLIAASTTALHPKYLTTQALENCHEIYNRSLWHFPIDNARIAITAPTFKHTFIDLYRCLEWLYSLPRSLKLKSELGLTLKGTELAKAFREKLSWRRTELDSLELLIIDADSRHLNPADIEKCLGEPLPTIPSASQPLTEGQPKTLEEWNEKVSRKLAKKIYALRNQFVHQLDASEIIRISISEEQHFINLLTEICLMTYHKYASEF